GTQLYRLSDRRVVRAGLDEYDANAERAQLVRERFRQRLERELRSSVMTPEGTCDDPAADRTDLDDHPRSLAPHHRQSCARHPQRPEHVDVELALNLVDWRLLDRSPQRITGVVDHRVEAPLSIDDPLDRPIDGLNVRHVEPNELACLGEVGSGPTRVAHAGIDAVPAHGELLADQPAESTRRPRDEAHAHRANLTPKNERLPVHQDGQSLSE